MSGEWFLWGGFVFSCLWHFLSWATNKFKYDESQEGIGIPLVLMNLGLSGVSLCAFGYLVF